MIKHRSTLKINVRPPYTYEVRNDKPCPKNKRVTTIRLQGKNKNKRATTIRLQGKKKNKRATTIHLRGEK